MQRCGAASIDAARRNIAGLCPCTGQRGAAAGGAGCSGARRVEEEDDGLACGPGALAARGWREEKRRAAAADRAGSGGEEGKRRGEKERGGPAGLVLAHAEVSPFSFFFENKPKFQIQTEVIQRHLET